MAPVNVLDLEQPQYSPVSMHSPVPSVKSDLGYESASPSQETTLATSTSSSILLSLLTSTEPINDSYKTRTSLLLMNRQLFKRSATEDCCEDEAMVLAQQPPKKRYTSPAALEHFKILQSEQKSQQQLTDQNSASASSPNRTRRFVLKWEGSVPKLGPEDDEETGDSLAKSPFRQPLNPVRRCLKAVRNKPAQPASSTPPSEQAEMTKNGGRDLYNMLKLFMDMNNTPALQVLLNALSLVEKQKQDQQQFQHLQQQHQQQQMLLEKASDEFAKFSKSQRLAEQWINCIYTNADV